MAGVDVAVTARVAQSTWKWREKLSLIHEGRVLSKLSTRLGVNDSKFLNNASVDVKPFEIVNCSFFFISYQLPVR